MSVGRRRVLDDVKRREVCALVSAGCSLKTAAIYVGCNPSTIRREAFRNHDFHEQLRKAEMSAELHPLNALHQAATKHWRAAAWLLERTRPDQFARHSSLFIRLDEVDALLTGWLEVMALSLPDTPECNAAYRRLELARQNVNQELAAACAIGRDPKRIRQVIDRLKPRHRYPHIYPDQDQSIDPQEIDSEREPSDNPMDEPTEAKLP
jgi:hypothetical protein